MGFFDPGSGIIAGLVGGKPNMPAFTPIDVQAQQNKAISGNIAALPQAEQLASSVNTFNTAQIQKMLESAIPGYNSITGKVSSTIQDELAGKVPTDVGNAIQLSDAAKALTGGYAGSTMHGNLVARDLGLTSLDLVNKGLTTAQSWLATMDNMFKQGQFNLSSMFITPEFQTQTAVEERNAQFQHDWASNLNDWTHSLGYFAMNEINQDSAQFNQMASSIVGKFAGAAMGGL